MSSLHARRYDDSLPPGEGAGEAGCPAIPDSYPTPLPVGEGLTLQASGQGVRISKPSSVTATVCSHCADSEWSLVTTVQPSGSWRVCGLPALTIGSTVKVIPFFSSTPVSGLP